VNGYHLLAYIVIFVLALWLYHVSTEQ